MRTQPNSMSDTVVHRKPICSILTLVYFVVRAAISFDPNSMNSVFTRFQDAYVSGEQCNWFWAYCGAQVPYRYENAHGTPTTIEYRMSFKCLHARIMLKIHCLNVS